MQDDMDRPTTETKVTPEVPVGKNVKDLVTPGDDASVEAEVEQAQPEGETPGGDEAGSDPGDVPEEERSPTRGDR